MEEIRIALFLAMFAVLGWFDLRTREIDTRVFVAFGGAGVLLYAFDWHGVTQLAVLLAGGMASGALVLWRARLFGTGDLLAVFAGTAICPAHAGMVMFPAHEGVLPAMLPVLAGGLVLSLASAVSWNVVLNVSDVARRGGVFCEVADCRARKCAAFFTVHRQRRFERHVFVAEETAGGRRMLKLGTKPPDQEFARIGTAKYVECASPLMLFSAVAAFVLLAERLAALAAW